MRCMVAGAAVFGWRHFLRPNFGAERFVDVGTHKMNFLLYVNVVSVVRLHRCGVCVLTRTDSAPTASI